MKKQFLQRTAAAVMAFALLAAAAPTPLLPASVVYAEEAAPAPVRDYTDGGCVDWVKDRARQLWGLELPRTTYEPSGVAGAVNWWYNLDYPRGQVPVPHAIAVWSGGGTTSYVGYGHVAFVEDVFINSEGKLTWTLSEGGFSRYSNGWRLMDHTANDRPTYTFLGYVYLDPAHVPSASTTKKPAYPVTLYRYYNPNSGEHIYTSNQTEMTNLKNAGWKDEGKAWTAPKVSGTPVYRFYNPNNGDHHFTKDPVERNILLKAGWNDEGIGWYSDNDQTLPLYRFYNPNATGPGSHHYTTDPIECGMLLAAGWNDEGVAWYGME